MKLDCILLFIILTSTCLVSGEFIVFNNKTSNLWSDTLNWSSDRLPTLNDDVLINSSICVIDVNARAKSIISHNNLLHVYSSLNCNSISSSNLHIGYAGYCNITHINSELLTINGYLFTYDFNVKYTKINGILNTSKIHDIFNNTFEFTQRGLINLFRSNSISKFETEAKYLNIYNLAFTYTDPETKFNGTGIFKIITFDKNISLKLLYLNISLFINNFKVELDNIRYKYDYIHTNTSIEFKFMEIPSGDIFVFLVILLWVAVGVFAVLIIPRLPRRH